MYKVPAHIPPPAPVLFAQLLYRITLYRSLLFVDNISLFWEDKRGAETRLAIWSWDLEANGEVRGSAADVQRRSDEGKQRVKWHSAGKRAVFMDVISLMV